MDHNLGRENVKDKRELRGADFFTPAVISTASAILISALTGAAYLTGVSYHRSYLASFRAPYGIINKSTTDYFLCAHKAIVVVLEEFFSTPGMIVLEALFLWLCLLALFQRFSKRFQRHRQLRKLRVRVKRSARLRFFGEVLGLPAILSAFAFYIVFVLTFVLVIPGAIGEYSGRHDAESVKALIKGGCTHQPAIQLACTDVMHEGRPVARGYILDASDKHVFLVGAEGNKVLPIGENSFFTEVVPVGEKTK